MLTRTHQRTTTLKRHHSATSPPENTPSLCAGITHQQSHENHTTESDTVQPAYWHCHDRATQDGITQTLLFHPHLRRKLRLCVLTQNTNNTKRMAQTNQRRAKPLVRGPEIDGSAASGHDLKHGVGSTFWPPLESLYCGLVVNTSASSSEGLGFNCRQSGTSGLRVVVWWPQAGRIAWY